LGFKRQIQEQVRSIDESFLRITVEPAPTHDATRQTVTTVGGEGEGH
jgi:hypothetical protein